MTTLVVCLDRTDDVGRKTGLRSPIVGWEAVRALVTDVGLADPEDSSVNSLLESLRVAQELRDEDEETVVAVVSGDRESMVSADRAVARQVDDLVATYDPESAVVIIDSAEDERLVPIVESRVRVDSVDRVVVRQARDIESTYYLLKQFLADEELRQTVLVPIGLTLLVFPVLAITVGPAEGAAAITTVIGLFLLYKGFSIDEFLTGLGHQIREALYAGQVSIVTYVVAGGLTLVGLFAGALGVSGLSGGQTENALVPAATFVFEGVPWFAVAALTASAGRLLDEIIRDRPLGASYLNLPFIVVAIGTVVRGFSAYFLETQEVIGPVVVPELYLGWRTIESFQITAGERLATFVTTGIIVSLLGVRIAASFSGRGQGETDSTGDNGPDSGSASELADDPGSREGRADSERLDAATGVTPPETVAESERTDGGARPNRDDGTRPNRDGTTRQNAAEDGEGSGDRPNDDPAGERTD